MSIFSEAAVASIGFMHKHKKRKDSLKTRAVVQNFHNKLEFLRIAFN